MASAFEWQERSAVGATLRGAARSVDRGGPKLVGTSTAALQLRDRIARYGPTTAPVLLLGETGVGKEVVARALHAASPRAARPFVAVDCGAIPESLFECELFGAKRGAFTGATRDRPGLFAEARSGTLLLDEVGELPPVVQSKLLRVLETGRLRPLGGDREGPMDVRVLAATNRPLADAVLAGRFRADLYYRLDVLRIEVPALSERRQDIPALLEALALEVLPPGAEVHVAARAITSLMHVEWRGNVRELRNVLLRAFVDARGGAIEHFDLGRDALTTPPDSGRIALEGALSRSDGRLAPAARELGVSVRTVQRRLKAFELTLGDFKRGLEPR